MWTRAVLLSVLFSCYQVLGQDISDVTTVYEVGKSTQELHDIKLKASTEHLSPCIDGVSGHVHSRTNALGMGFIDKKDNFLETNHVEHPNITFDASCFAQWELPNENVWVDDTFYTKKIQIGSVYKTQQIMTLKIFNMQRKSDIFFTKGPGDLREEEIYFVIRFYDSSRTDIFYNCGNGGRRYGAFQGERDGSHAEVYCHYYTSEFSFDSSNDYLSIEITEDKAKFYRGMGESKSFVREFDYGPGLDVNYFSISPTDVTSDADSFSLVYKALKVTDGEMVSPVFTPKSDNLCLAMLFHSSIASLSPELEVSALGSENREYRLDTIQNVKIGLNVKVINQKLRDLSPISLKIQKVGLANIGIARIASCNPDGEEVLELPSQISVCTSDRAALSSSSRNSSLDTYSTVADIAYGVESVYDTDHKCWNKGVLTTAGCACPPGFIGSSCDTGCGRNRFGHDCEGLCSLHDEECRGLLMCNKFTGCHCAPGYTGNECTQACAPGWYGNDCSERCGHCAGNSTCDIYTGECTACEEGYLAPHCKRVSVYYGSKPAVTSPSYGTIVVSFDPDTYITVAEPPQFYQIQFRKKVGQWQVYTTKPIQKFGEASDQERKISEKIEGLETGVVYEVRVLMMDNDLLKYDGSLVQVAEVLSKCDVPVFYNYKLTSTASFSSITFYWKYAIDEEYSCPLETFEVTWKEGWKWPKSYTYVNNFTLSELRPGAEIKFKVRAKTTGGFVPYSKILIASTQQRAHPPVQNIRVEARQSTSVELSWEPPRGSEDRQLRYTISYKCVDRPACSPGCQNVSEAQLTQEGTSITLSPLLAFTKYLVTVSVEGGVESSIYVGTTKVVPTEVPSLSAQRPVRTNTSVSVFWDQPTVCTGYLLGYNYQLTKSSDALKILASGFTKETYVSFHNLTASTEYIVRVFVSTVAGWNPLSYLAINISTSATVPEIVRNLTVYKRGRGMLGLRWAEPLAIYGHLKSFTLTHSLGQEVTSHTVEPSHCVVWPDFYCHTIEGLRSNRRYNVTVSARNAEVSEDGEPAVVTAITKETSPTAPVNLKLINSTSTSIVLQWGPPDLGNGIVRSFLVSVEETEKYDQESCCQVYPLVETPVKEELQVYDAEVSGLHPASTYYVSVSAKTVGLGPSQSLVVSTRPPHLPLTLLPRVQVPEISWLPQDKPPEVNNSEVYTSLVRAHILLAVVNETQPIQLADDSGIKDPKLDSLLQQKIGANFSFIADYNEDDEVQVSGPLEDTDSPWGRPPASLLPGVAYQLVATQVLEYNGVYNVDLRYSSKPFMLD